MASSSWRRRLAYSTLIRYEELVSQPAATLEKLWACIELQDQHAQAITRACAAQLAPPPAPELSATEQTFLLQAQDIVAAVAARLGYVT